MYLRPLILPTAIVATTAAMLNPTVTEGTPPEAKTAPVAAAAEAPAKAALTAADERTLIALESLGGLVPMQSHSAALRYAFEAYFNYRLANPGEVTKPYLYFVDFGLPSTTPRGYVFDMDAMAIVEGPFTVAHGRGSVDGREPVPSTFSNRPGSNMTSLGLYRAAETYSFHGKSGGRAYRSVGLRMDGLSSGFNSAARSRGIVAHGAPYVTSRRAGRSEGCPAMEPDRAERLLPLISGGSLVFLFSPEDREWMEMEPWVNDKIAPALPKILLSRFG